MNINNFLIVATGIIVGSGLLYLLYFLWRNVLNEQKDTRIEELDAKFIPATKELSYSTGNIFKLSNFKAKKIKQQEKDENFLDKPLAKIVYRE